MSDGQVDQIAELRERAEKAEACLASLARDVHEWFEAKAKGWPLKPRQDAIVTSLWDADRYLNQGQKVADKAAIAARKAAKNGQ